LKDICKVGQKLEELQVSNGCFALSDLKTCRSAPN